MTKKWVNANARVFLMQHLWEGWHIWQFSLMTTVISFSQFCFPFFWEVVKISWSFFFCYLSNKMGMQKIFVVLSHSLLSKLTQLWRLALLRNPEMWKGPLGWSVYMPQAKPIKRRHASYSACANILAMPGNMLKHPLTNQAFTTKHQCWSWRTELFLCR